jgi:DnaK suppressor protein
MHNGLDINFLRQQLETQQQTLVGRINSEKNKSQGRDVTNPDRADLAYSFTAMERSKALLEKLSEQLEQVEAALQRMDEEVYGICMNCGKPISAARLTAIPYAATCFDCQSQKT